MDELLWSLGECWKDLGRPAQVQLDKARELAGWGPAARTLSRVIRLGLRFGDGPVFIPEGEPQFDGGVEHFNGWFQEPLFQGRYHRPTHRRASLRASVSRTNVASLGAKPEWAKTCDCFGFPAPWADSQVLFEESQYFLVS
jgi:hypothetical protein